MCFETDGDVPAAMVSALGEAARPFFAEGTGALLPQQLLQSGVKFLPGRIGPVRPVPKHIQIVQMPHIRKLLDRFQGEKEVIAFRAREEMEGYLQRIKS